VGNVQEFQEAVDATKAGESIRIQIYRDEKFEELQFGAEMIQEWWKKWNAAIVPPVFVFCRPSIPRLQHSGLYDPIFQYSISPIFQFLGLAVEALDDRNSQELHSFLFQKGFFIGRGRSLNVPLLDSP